MAFKTFECHLLPNTLFSDVPPEGWATENSFIAILPATGDINVYTLCDPDKSKFVGAAPVNNGMEEADFYILWAAIAGLMVTGWIFKQLRHSLGKH